MKRRVYVETTIVSYLTARPSRTSLLAEHQRITREWWKHRERFELFTSQTVMQEASQGNADAVRRRLDALQGIEILESDTDVAAMAQCLIDRRALPDSAWNDGIHIAVAIINGLDYVLTWNCAHVANAAARRHVEQVCREAGRHPPVLCTPKDLMGDPAYGTRPDRQVASSRT